MLAHHVVHLPLRRYVARRNRIEISRIGRSVLLVIHALSTQSEAACIVDRGVVVGRGQHYRHLGGQFRVSPRLGITSDHNASPRG